MEPDLETVLSENLEVEADVRVAWLFGSRARGDSVAESDWDVAVLLPREASPRRRLELMDLLGRATGASVDVIDIERAPVELASRAICEGRVLMERDVRDRVEAEARILARAHDLAPLLRRQRREILEEGGHERAVERYREALGAARRLHEQAGSSR